MSRFFQSRGLPSGVAAPRANPVVHSFNPSMYAESEMEDRKESDDLSAGGKGIKIAAAAMMKPTMRIILSLEPPDDSIA